MLASITPLGERGRQQRWSVTATAFAGSALAAAAGLGALLGLTGELALPAGHPEPRLLVLAGGAAVALGLDLRAVLGGARLPGPRRQVDQRWLTAFRGWVYGAGFGFQLGLGISTIVTSAATYLALLAALLSGSPARGAVIFGSLGLVRGLALLPAARVSSPGRLVALHRRLERLRRPAASSGLLALAAILAAALLGAR